MRIIWSAKDPFPRYSSTMVEHVQQAEISRLTLSIPIEVGDSIWSEACGSYLVNANRVESSSRLRDRMTSVTCGRSEAEAELCGTQSSRGQRVVTMSWSIHTSTLCYFQKAGFLEASNLGSH